MRTAVIGLGRMGLRHLKIACRLGHDIVGLFDRREELVGDALRDGDAAREVDRGSAGRRARAGIAGRYHGARRAVERKTAARL